MNYKTKQNLLRIGVIIVAVLLIFGLVRLFSGSNKYEDYSKTRINWTVGGLDDMGAFDDESEGTMVSQSIEIGEGFLIEPDFNKSVTYQVYFYDDKDNFLYVYVDDDSNTTLKNILEVAAEELTDYEETIPTHFRVVITPNDKDGEIKLLESWKYAGHITVYELNSGKKK